MKSNTSRSIVDRLHSMLTGYMARTGMMLFVFDPNDADTKAAITAAVEEATKGLAAKNTELLGEVKKLRKSSDITPEKLAEVEAERDRLAGELTVAQKAAKDAAKVAETATKQLQAETGFTQNLLIDNGLVGELTKNGVTNPVHIKAAQAMLRAGVKVVVDGENRIAKVGEKALGDFVKEWAASDEGKFFVAAPANGGGGAPGGNGGAGTKILTRTAFNALTPAAQSAHVKEGGTLTD